MVNMGSGTGGWVVPGIAPPGPPHIPYPGYTPPATDVIHAPTAAAADSEKQVVGLKSVAQLSLCAHISVFEGITEVYNLRIAGKSNNHLVIPGNE